MINNNNNVRQIRHDLYVHHQLQSDYFDTLIRKIVENFNNIDHPSYNDNNNDKNLNNDNRNDENNNYYHHLGESNDLSASHVAKLEAKSRYETKGNFDNIKSLLGPPPAEINNGEKKSPSFDPRSRGWGDEKGMGGERGAVAVRGTYEEEGVMGWKEGDADARDGIFIANGESG